AGGTLPVPRGRAVSPPEIAYALPTSGTTGQPKLPVIGRGALAHHLSAVSRAYRLGETDVVLQTSSPGFDVWIEETLSAAWSGAHLVLSARGLWQSFADLDRAVARHGVTVLNLPTSYWTGWLDHLVQSGLGPAPSLRLVVVGSEQVPAQRFREWRERWPHGP